MSDLAPDNVSPFAVFLVFVVGAVLAVYAVRMVRTEMALTSWPSAKAKILEFELQTGGDDGNTHWFARPIVKYSYVVNGVRYESTDASPSKYNYQAFQKEKVERQFANWRKGATIRCWYDRENPAEAYVINEGLTYGPILQAGFGLLLMLPLLRRYLPKRPSSTRDGIFKHSSSENPS